MISAEDLNYAKNLRSLREKSGWKQALAAELIGLTSQQEYSKLEKGKRCFTNEIIYRVCKTFKISPSEFRRLSRPRLPREIEDIIFSDKQVEIQNNITAQGLCTLLLETRIKCIKAELEANALKIEKLMPPKYDVPPGDYKIYIQCYNAK